MDHRVVTAQFAFERRTDRVPEAFGSRPVRGPIDGTAVAQHDGRVLCLAGAFQFTLHEEDRALRATPPFERSNPWKASAEHDACGFRQNLHVRAELLANELEDRGLAGARPARQ